MRTAACSAGYKRADAAPCRGYRGKDLRGNNKGWRLDYFLVSEALCGSVHDCFHLPGVMGSDHCPLGIELKMGGG